MALNLVPQSTDTLASTQQPILQNFTTINDAFLVDHTEYGLADEGKHNQTTFPIHVGPIPANGAPEADEIYLFNQNAAPTNIPDIWMQRGAGTPFPITGSDDAATGWSYLPSGILLKWGSTTIGSGGIATITAAQGPAYTNMFIVQLTEQLFSGSLQYSVFFSSFPGPANQFNVNITRAGGAAFSYLIIGN